MPTICPKCSYARKESDTAPLWQCPSCQVAYSKVGDTSYGSLTESANERRPSAGFRAAPEVSGGGWKWALVLVVVGMVAWQGKSLFKRTPSSTDEQSVQSSGQPEIVLYSATWCGYCTAARQFFKDNRIRVTEYDVENTAEGIEGFKKFSEGGGVPLIIIGNETIHGFNEPKLRRKLKAWVRDS